MLIEKGKILEFRGSWGSGLGYLVIEDSKTGQILAVPCENASTVRALEGAFGNVIAPGHSVDPQGGHVGQEVYWSYDDMGLTLEAFTPVDQASPELIEHYEKQYLDQGICPTCGEWVDASHECKEGEEE